MMPSEWHDWHDFYMLLGTRLGCAGGAVVRRGVDRGKFSHARAQRRHANLHEPGRFPFQHASHHQSHRDGAVPHRAIARDRHHARRRRLACLHDRGFWSALPVPRSAISPIGSVTEFYRWCLMSRCLPRRASSFRALHSRRYPGRSAAPSTRSQHPQCVGPDACFCAPGRHQELGYLIAARREQTARL